MFDFQNSFLKDKARLLSFFWQAVFALDSVLASSVRICCFGGGALLTTRYVSDSGVLKEISFT